MQCPRCKKDTPGFLKKIAKKTKRKIMICTKADGGCGYWRLDKDEKKPGSETPGQTPGKQEQKETQPPKPEVKETKPPAGKPAGKPSKEPGDAPWYDRDIGDLVRDLAGDEPSGDK